MTHLLSDAQKKTQAKKHYLCALYHSVFGDRRGNTQIICWSSQIDGQAGVSVHEAQILVRHRMALIRVDTDTGIAYLTATTTGARKAGQNRSLYDHRSQLISCVPQYAREGVPIDMEAVADACSRYAYKFTVNGLY